MQEICECVTQTELLEETLDLWRESSCRFPPLGRQYSTADQLEREELFDECLQIIQSESCQILETESKRKTARERVAGALAKLGTCAIDLEDPCVEHLLSNNFASVGSDLSRWARDLDPLVTAADIFQACRNAWTAGGMQLLLGRAIQLTPAIFGYSMLYPYSDNFMDDIAVSPVEKLAFSRRFRMRLAGCFLEPANRLETVVWQLVALIEFQYPRKQYPEVYSSLLAIHHAQEKSMAQLQQNGSLPEQIDVLTLSFTKGGTSVLADAYLAAGTLTPAQVRFAFQWGVLLQLGDDLQDLRQDLACGSITLFTQAARRQPLDTLTNRTLQLAQHVMTRMDDLGAPLIIKQLLQRSSRSLLIRAAAAAREFYSKEYLAELETYSPVRFAFLASRQQQFDRRRAWFARAFEALVLQEDSSTGTAAVSRPHVPDASSLSSFTCVVK